MVTEVFRCPNDGSPFPASTSRPGVHEHFCGGCAFRFRVWVGPVLRRSSESRTIVRKKPGAAGEYERSYTVEIESAHGPRTFAWSMPGRDEDVYIRAKDEVLIVEIGTSRGMMVCGAGRTWPWGVQAWRPVDRAQRELLEPMAYTAAVATCIVYLWAVAFEPAALLWGVGVGLAALAAVALACRVRPGPVAPLPALAVRCADSRATVLSPPLPPPMAPRVAAIHRPAAKGKDRP